MTHARVALLTTYYHPVLGGAETAARRLAAFLKQRGHEIVVITKRTDPALPAMDTIDDVPIVRVGLAGARHGAGKWTIIPWAFVALWRRRSQYDVICVIDYRGIGLAAILAGKLLRRPVAIQAQTEGVLSADNWAPALARTGVPGRHRLARALSWPLRRAYGAADAVVCISRAIRAEAIAEGIPADRVHDIPNTVDVVRFRPAAPGERDRLRAERGWPVDRTIGVFVGRLSREKGIVDLLTAWERLSASALLVVVGPDMAGHRWDEGPRVREMAATAALAGRVLLFGASDDTAPLYRAADFAVVPSHWESFGISAAEAMASGLPVVASAVGGLTDYVIDGGNGRLVPPHDAGALAAAIDDVCLDAPRRLRLGQAARDAVLRFDERLVLDRFGAMLDRLAELGMSEVKPADLFGLRRNIFFATVSSGTAALLLVVMVLAGRILGTEGYGRFALALAWASIGESLMDWGLHQVAIRAVARDRQSAQSLFRNSIALKLGPSILTVIGIALAIRWAQPSTEIRTACLLLVIAAVMRSYLLSVRGVLQGLEFFAWDSVVVVLDRVLLLTLSAAVLLSGGRVIALAWAFLLARTLALTAALIIGGPHIGGLTPAFDMAIWRELRQRAWPIGLFLILLNLYSYIDTIMLGQMATDVETGVYNSAYRIYEGLAYGAAILSAVLTPRLSAEFVRDRVRHSVLARQGLAASVGLAILVTAATWMGAHWVMVHLFGEAWAPSTRPLQILSVGLIMVFPIWILQAIAISMGAERVLLRTIAIGVCVNVTANLFLIPAAGSRGAALATVIGETVNLLLLLYAMRAVLVRPAR